MAKLHEVSLTINTMVSVSAHTEITKYALTSLLKNIDFLFFSINATFTTDWKITFWFLVFSFSFEISFSSYMCAAMCVHVWKHESLREGDQNREKSDSRFYTRFSDFLHIERN